MYIFMADQTDPYSTCAPICMTKSHTDSGVYMQRYFETTVVQNRKGHTAADVSAEEDGEWSQTATLSSVGCITNTRQSSSDSVVYTNIH